MGNAVLFRCCAFVAVLAVAWWFVEPLSPMLMTLIGLAIMAGATVTLCIAMIRRPSGWRASLKAWWRLFWDGFWGLG
jgi:hypothetical protein